jgi:hypothetical protein
MTAPREHTPCEPPPCEPWAMDALAILARRLAPASPAQGRIRRPAVPPRTLARNLDTLIAERNHAPC